MPSQSAFTDTYLSDADRRAIHDFALAARELLMSETRDLLEGVYGLRADGQLLPLTRLANLASDAEGQETYRRLSHFLDDEVKGGLGRREAVDKLVKEVAFTHLNRLVAFKMMEARKLIRQAVSRGKESNGFKFFLADYPAEEALWKSGTGVDAAYRHFLLWQSGQVARELKVLFDSANLPSRLFPRPTELQQLLDLLNSESLTPAWASPETIGWVYQYFNEREKSDVFDRLYKKKLKIRREDIPAATQLFTPRWIVRFLVENTLGRMWVQMHPDSRLKAELRYLVPLSGEVPPEPLKPVREITLLDPACGTMHFGLVAFDLFAEMYREELDSAGKTGWPDTPSVANENEIATAIIANNLFGIDIDLRAVQLSALTLYLKAKELNKDARIADSNLACADVLALNGDRLNSFLKEMNFQRPAYERLIRALWARLRDINQLGSLLRLEQEIAGLIKVEQKLFEKEGRQPDFFGERVRFENDAARKEYWDIVETQLVQAFDEFARRAAEKGADETLFTGEATKGLRVLNLMLQRYDCATTNPPYRYKREINSTLADFLDDAYPDANDDLYAAFIKRCCEFAHTRGRIGMITQQSFMFLSSYKTLRNDLLENFAVETMAHTGPRAFAEIKGEKVNTTVFVLRADPDSEQRFNSIGTYFRLVKAPNKQGAFERALVDDSNVYRVQQARFDAIPSRPWAYWVTDRIRGLFETLPSLGSFDPPREGINTGDNERFVRYWWEVGKSRVASGKYAPFAMGAPTRRFYDEIQEVLRHDVNQIRLLPGAAMRNQNYAGREAIAFVSNATGGFRARLIPSGCMFCSTGGRAIFATRIELLSVLAILNSGLARYLLNLLNPTVTFTVGDIGNLPLTADSGTTLLTLCRLAVVRNYRDVVAEETSRDFISPWPWSDVGQGMRQQQLIKDLETQINSEVYRLYGIGAEDRLKIEAELQPESAGEEENQTASGHGRDGNRKNAAAKDGMTGTCDALAAQWISFAVGIVMGRFSVRTPKALGSAVYSRQDFGVGSLTPPSESEFNELVGFPDTFAYVDAIGSRHVFSAEMENGLGRLVDTDGIVVLDNGHPDDLPGKVQTALEIMLGERRTAEVIAAVGGNSANEATLVLRLFLEHEFFTKWHVKWYQQRPVYWPLQSPKKLFSLYVYHERLTKDTLFIIQRKYIDPKINLTKQLLAEKREAAKKNSVASERRQLSKEADEAEKLLVDLEDFAKNLKAVTDRGYDPDIDDGVILNMAPLWQVIPSWSKEPQKYWDGLENGDYDWSHMAMKYWPERVKAKCKTDKSLAIAHGLA